MKSFKSFETGTEGSYENQDPSILCRLQSINRCWKQLMMQQLRGLF